MALTGLPTELLDEIILYALPEGFESLALTCKGIYALCAPFIQRHNKLRLHFRCFKYFGDPGHPWATTIGWNMITRIAVEPIVARYVQYADFGVDGRHYRGGLRDMLPDFIDPHCREAVVKLLAGPLEQVGIDWKEFYAEIEEDLEERRFSQNAAAFLLTLLPNVEILEVPWYWKPNIATAKLLDSIVREAKRSHLLGNRPALAQVTRLETHHAFVHNQQLHLKEAVPFLALPCVRSFHARGAVAMDDSLVGIASKYPYSGYGETLEAVHLLACCIDETAIADFLKHTPRLKTLEYTHSTRRGYEPEDWDICKFVTAIAREAGNNLDELTVSIYRRDLNYSISPGKASMRGFRRLRKLEFPLEIAMCNITSATSTDTALDYSTFIEDLVPASVSWLSLISKGKNHHERALDAMFRHFASNKDSQLPALKEITVTRRDDSDDAYKEQCEKLVADMGKEGVEVRLTPWWSRTRSWGEEKHWLCSLAETMGTLQVTQPKYTFHEVE
jgi:hypothetical protein